MIALPEGITAEEAYAVGMSLTESEARQLYYDWGAWARPAQTMPDGDWRTWLLLGGRGSGKTRPACEAVREMARDPRAVIALVGPTSADVRQVIVEGESGILNVCPPEERPRWQPSVRRLSFPSGAVAFTYSAEEPERLRGPQHSAAYCDELAAYPDPKGLWDLLLPGLRLGRNPRRIVSTTPKPLKFLHDLIADPGTVVSRMKTWDNRANLPDTYIDELQRIYGGTRIGRQELEGELLDEAEGALWSRRRIDDLRIKGDACGEMVRIVVAIDPATTSGPDSDECGIIAAGLGADGHGYVLADKSCRLPPDQWASRAVSLFDQLSADKVIAETNNGGDMVGLLLKTVRPNLSYEKITASRGKVARAEPVAALYEQGKIHHLGAFPELEDEMCNFVPGGLTKSPNRCFIKGTQIQTEHGQKPIEAIMAGDLVCTRAGLRPVTAAMMTDDCAEVMTLSLSDGRQLTGTPDHPVFVRGKGFVRMDALVWGDIVEVWRDSENASSLTGRSITGTPMPNSGTHEFITERSAVKESAPVFSIGISGSRFTDRYQREATSTMRTTTRLITIRAIWNALRSANMRVGIRECHDRNCWSESGRSLPNGMDQNRDWYGIRNRVNTPGQSASRFWPSASFAANRLKATSLTGYASVPAAACGDITNVPESITRPACAPSVATNSLSSNRKSRRAAPVRVVASCACERAPVYDLTVAGAHEYYANGVLVHNCDAMVWAFSWLMLRPRMQGRALWVG